VSYNGTLKTVNLPTAEILKKTSILPRDLVGLNLTSRQERGKERHMLRPPTAILPRTDSILLSFGNVRAVAGRDSVYLLDAHRPVCKSFAKELASLYQNIQNKSVDSISDDSYTSSPQEPPELIFLEAVLEDTVDTFTRRVRLYEPIVDDFLGRVANEVFSDAGVHQLVPLKDSLQSFELQVKQALQCLTDLLNDDEDMLKLLLTEQAQASATGQPVEFERHQHVELLLGGYARQIGNLLQEVNYLLKRLQSKQEFVALALAGYRNRMVRMNVTIGIAGVSVGVATAMSGFFGMNLINGLESDPNAFAFMVATSSVSSAVVAAFCMNFLSGRAMQVRAERRLNEIETLTGALSDMCALDYTVKKMMQEGKPISREEFKKKLVQSRQSGEATDQEIDLLFHVLDTSKDGHLSSEDFSKALQNTGRTPSEKLQ
jgi:magnesium transporter